MRIEIESTPACFSLSAILCRRGLPNRGRKTRGTQENVAGELPVSRPAVSQHLKVLKDAGLVVDQPVGTRRVYRVEPDGLAELRADLERFWGKALAAYKVAVEQPTKEDE